MTITSKTNNTNLKGNIYIELYMNQIWDHVTNIRIFIENYLKFYYDNENNIHDICFSTSELLENAVKFSNGGDIHLIIQSISNKMIEINVENNASIKNIKILKKEIEVLEKLTSDQIYHYKLNTILEKKGEIGGMGLVMIKGKTGGKFFLAIKETNISLTYLFNLQI
jgi:hypothetical protein